MRTRSAPAVAALAAVVVVLFSALAPSAAGGAPFVASALSDGTPGATHSIWNVVVIYLENKDIQDFNALRAPSYFHQLSTTYVNVTRFSSVCHPSVPNYLAILDGNPQQCGSETTHRGLYRNATLPDLLEEKGLTWGGYFESMKAPCQGVSSSPNPPIYLANFNPFIMFSDIWNNKARCDAHVVNSSVFNATLSSQHRFPANFSLYVPNSENSCHYDTLLNCQTYMQKFLTPILTTTNPQLATDLRHTLFFILPDESDDVHLTGPGGRGDGIPGNTTSYDGAGYDGLYGGNVWLGVINTGGYLKGGHYTTDASIYNLLTTIEWLFNLGNTGGVDHTAAFPPMTGLFTFSSNND